MTGCLALTLGSAGCASPPEVAVTPPADQREACASVVEAVPETIDGLDRRDVEPRDAAGAAWGEPAVVLSCGVPSPPGLTRTSPCLEVDGIGWYVPDDAVQDLGDGTGGAEAEEDVTLTSIGTEPLVSVAVPSDHRPPAGILADLAPALRDVLASVAPCR